MGRPAVKKTYRETKAKRKAELQAELEFDKKLPFLERLKRLIQKKIEQIDPLEVAGVLAGTYVIHGILQKSEEFMNKLSPIALATPTGAAKYLSSWWLPAWQALITGQQESFVKEFTGQKAGFSVLETHTPDVYLWLVSFVLAVLLVKHGGELLGLAEKGVTQLGIALLA